MKARKQRNESEYHLHRLLRHTEEEDQERGSQSRTILFQFTLPSPEESNFERIGSWCKQQVSRVDSRVFTERNMASLQLFFHFVFIVAALNISLIRAALPGMLFPKDSERREVKDLSGMWDFRADMSDNRNGGFENMWFAKPLWQVSLEI